MLRRTFGVKKSGRIGIIGAGPCGLTLALLLKAKNYPVTIFEAKSHEEVLNGHPAAHYVNARTFEVFGRVPGLNERIRSAIEPIEKFRHYRYCREIGGFNFQSTDQLNAAALSTLSKLTDEQPAHVSQPTLLRLMIEEYKDRVRMGGESGEGILWNNRVDRVDRDGNGMVNVTVGGNVRKNEVGKVGISSGGETREEKFDYVVLADGFRSRLRQKTSIVMQGDPGNQFFTRKKFRLFSTYTSLARN
jgi:2-polyprenyl-6-methoxyphenol hydroxylase-like FAD-dependent oxidoreductase